jgi:hypothetical protein
MAVNPLQWNPIRANFGDATGMMQSAGQSVERATDTVGNIFKQAQEAERQRLEQEDMLKRRAMEQERLGIAKAGEEREAETYRIESEGSVLGNNFYEEFNNIRQDKPELTPQEYIAGINVEGVDPRSLDIGLNNFMKKAKEDQDLVNTSFDITKKRREAETYKAIKDSGINYYATEEDVLTKANKLPTEARDEVIKTYQTIAKNKLEIEKLKESKNAKIKPEELNSIMASLNLPDTTLEQKNTILTDAILKHRNDSATVKALEAALTANFRAMGIEQDKAKLLADSLKGKNKFNKQEFNQDPLQYTQKKLKDFGYTEETIKFLSSTTQAIRDRGGDINPELLNSIYLTTEGKNTAETNGFTAMFSGKLGQETTLYGDEAKLELSEQSPFIETDKGIVIDIKKPVGIKILEAIKAKEEDRGTPKSDINKIPIIKDTEDYFKEPNRDNSIKTGLTAEDYSNTVGNTDAVTRAFNTPDKPISTLK